MFKYWLIIFFICFCLGDAAAFYEKQKIFFVSIALVVLWSGIFGSYYFLRRFSSVRWDNRFLANLKQDVCILLAILMLLSGFLAGSRHEKVRAQWHTLLGKRIVLQGAVQPDSLRIKKQGISALLSAEKPLRGKVRIFIQTDKNADFIARQSVSQKIQIAGVLKEAVYLRNPGTYDGEKADRIRGIYGKMTVDAAQMIGINDPLPLPLRFSAFSQQIREKAFSRLHSRTAAVLPGMILGGYQGVDPALADIFRDNGIAHMLAVSGTHVAMLTLFLRVLFRPLGKRADYLIQFILLIYALLCGLQPGVLRSVLMACVLLWGRRQKRQADSVRLLLLTAFLLLVANPFWLPDISFQLSFVTTAGLLLACPKVTAYVPEFLPDWLRSLVGVALTAQLCSLPFSVYYFHRLSLIAIISNLCLLPALEAAALCFLTGLLFLSFLPVVSGVLFPVAEFLLNGAVAVGAGLAALPFAATDVSDWGIAGMLAYYGFLAAFLSLGPFIRFSSRQRKYWLGLMTGIFLALCLMKMVASRDLTVYFMDVGQGDAALVRTPAGKNILIDTGGLQGDADISRMVLLPCLRYLGVKQIDLLCLSHGDHDHAGGAAGLAANLPVKQVFLGGATENSEDVTRLLNVVRGKTKIKYPHSGEQWRIGDCDITVASADAGTRAAPGVTESNSASLVLQLFCQGHSVVFTGDADADTEEKAMPYLRAAEILKVSHHGADTSSSPHFLQRIKPRFAVISVGKENRYGHPGKETLQRLAGKKIIPLRTDRLGAIKIKFKNDGPRWYSYRYQGNQF